MNDHSVRGNPTTGLFGATLGFFTGFAGVALFGATIKSFEGAVGWTPAFIGLLISIPSLTGSLLRIPFSAWVDTSGGRKPFLVLLALSIAGLGGLAFLLSGARGGHGGLLLYILFFGALGGCGIATFSVGIGQTSYWFPQKKQGAALGTYAGIGNLAPGIFTVLLTSFALPALGLPGSYLAWLGFLGAGTALYFFTGRNAPYFQLLARGLPPERAKEEAASRFGQELFPKQRLWTGLALSAGRWQTWALVVVYFTTFGGFIALTAWLPRYWTSLFSLPVRTAGLLTLAYSTLASLVRVAGGKVSDRLGGEKTAIAALAFMAAGSIVMTLSRDVWLSLTGVLVMAAGMGVANAAVFKLVPQRVPWAVGGAAGWVGGIGAFGGFVFPNVLSLFLGRTPSVAVTGASSTAWASAVSGASPAGGDWETSAAAGAASTAALRSGDPGYAIGFTIFIALAILSIVIVLVLKRSAERR
jgi:NNP family nitrate/nitrite transporter-like MFS transporter